MSAALPSRYVGIINQGSTCYLNSVIQALYHLPQFRRTIFALKVKEDDSVLIALRNLFAQLEAGHKGITTTELTAAFGWNERGASVQHDVHELLQQLFDALETIVKGTPQETFIRDLFGGQQIYRSRATDGVHYVSDRLEGFYDMELVVQDKDSIDKSLQALTEPEKIDGVSIEVTPGAKPTKHNIERALSLLKLPPVLLIHPNRVGFDMNTFEPITLSNRWVFGKDLDLKPYMTSLSGLKLDKESVAKRAKLEASSGTLAGLTMGTQYELRSVLVHAGDANIGHYYTYVRFPNGEWVCFNDDLVDSATVEDVEKSAFGGTTQSVFGGRYRPFGSERASLLVYVNRECGDAILREDPASEEVLALAKRIENERAERWNTMTIPYFAGDESFVDVLDRVPDALERLSKTLKMSTSATAAEMAAVVGREIGTDGALVKFQKSSVRSSYSEYYYLAEKVPATVQRYRASLAQDEEATPTERLAAEMFGFLRVYEGLGRLGPVQTFHSWSDLSHKVPKGHQLYIYDAVNVDLTQLRTTNEITWGGNFISVPSGVDLKGVLDPLSKRQHKPTQVFLVDRWNRASVRRLFTLTVDDETTYTALQGGIYDVCKKNPKAVGEMPRSPQHIGLYEFDDYADKPLETLAPLTVRSRYDGTQIETTQALLCGRVKERRLFVALLPLPVADIDLRFSVMFRLGYADMPMVHFPHSTETCTTFGAILAMAFQQVGDHVPKALQTRYREMVAGKQNKCTIARLLLVEHGRVRSATDDLSTEVPTKLRGSMMLVIDPCAALLEGFVVVEVFFCSRRRGEDYFGYPTSIAVSASRSETGAALLLRIAKKLHVPDSEEAVKKWMLNVKNIDTKAIKLCEAKRVLADVLKAFDATRFEFLVDRPVVAELDGLEASEVKQDENGGIVIKSSSTADLLSL